jgi:hypothetical protein
MRAAVHVPSYCYISIALSQKRTMCVPSHRRSSASGGAGIDGGAGACSVTESVGKALHLLVNRLGMRRRMGRQEEECL